MIKLNTMIVWLELQVLLTHTSTVTKRNKLIASDKYIWKHDIS